MSIYTHNMLSIMNLDNKMLNINKKKKKKKKNEKNNKNRVYYKKKSFLLK